MERNGTKTIHCDYKCHANTLRNTSFPPVSMTSPWHLENVSEKRVSKREYRETHGMILSKSQAATFLAEAAKEALSFGRTYLRWRC